MEFEGKCAFITGAASGMGLKFSEVWAAEGGNVLMCDVNEAVLRDRAEEIDKKGPGHAIPCLCDVREYGQIRAARDRAVEAFGSVDLSVIVSLFFQLSLKLFYFRSAGSLFEPFVGNGFADLYKGKQECHY